MTVRYYQIVPASYGQYSRGADINTHVKKADCIINDESRKSEMCILNGMENLMKVTRVVVLLSRINKREVTIRNTNEFGQLDSRRIKLKGLFTHVSQFRQLFKVTGCCGFRRIFTCARVQSNRIFCIACTRQRREYFRYDRNEFSLPRTRRSGFRCRFSKPDLSVL